MEDRDGNEYCYLHPYIHQVGGHTSMLCLDEATVCKPVVERELQFYQNCPESLSKFTPGFYGVIEVDVVTDGDYITLVGSSPKNYTPKTSKFKRVRFRRSGSLEDELLFDDGLELFEEDTTPNPASTSNDDASTSVAVQGTSLQSGQTAPMNPWVIRCHREYLSTLAQTILQKKSPQNFLVLENLTVNLRLPCVLDLKVGTRQHDETDSLAKRQRKMAKVTMTTSARLGLRVAGMQVYQVTKARFLCRNKFYGRLLSAGGFNLALREFLHDGRRLRYELVPPLLSRLDQLYTTISDLPRLRLYTASLLLLYEGFQSDNKDEIASFDKTDVRIIDFAHSTSELTGCQGPDEGFLFGLENIIEMLKNISQEQE